MSSQNLVGSVAGVIVVFAVIRVLGNFMTGGSSVVGALIGLGLSVWLAWSLLQGSSFARWFTIVCMGIGGVGSIILGVSIFAQSAGYGFLMLLMGVVYMVCAGALLTPTAAEHFE